MDTDDLDQWLDEDLSTSATTTDPGWQHETSGGNARGQRPGRGEEARRTPSWRLIAIAAGAVWLAVMAVVFLGGGPDGTDGPDQLAVADGLLTTPDGVGTDGTLPDQSLTAGADQPLTASADQPLTAGADQPLTASDQSLTAGADQALGGGSEVDATTDAVAGVTPAAGAGPDDVSGAEAAVGGRAEAGAVRALRTHLTVSGDRTSYLEWATPVTLQRLDAGIVLVGLDAIWLEGTAEELSTVRHGRWAVPVGDEGQPLATPWPLTEADAPAPPDLGPPTGQLRLADITAALTTAGWNDVVAIASDPHPVLTDTLVALVDGTPPGAQAMTGVIVWLSGSASTALQLMGADR